MKERLAGMNELRETMRDQAASLATREQVALTAGAIEERLRSIENWSSNIQGRIVTLAGIWGLIVIVASALINFAIRKGFE